MKSWKQPQFEQMYSSETAASADDISHLSRSSSIQQRPSSYADSYNRVAQTLREALLRYDGGSLNPRHIVRNIFRRIDDNDSGVLTSQEMKDFVQSPELNLFNGNSANIEKFTELLVQQIDVNRDGTVTLEELEEFLFPEKSDDAANEIGIVLELTRKNLIRTISSTGAASVGSDDAILAEFIKLAKVNNTKKISQVEVRLAKKAFENLAIPEFDRNLLPVEVEGLIQTLDTNHDGVFSAKEFKLWLFPQQNRDDQHLLSKYLVRVIEEKFHNNIRLMFNTFKTYGMDRISRADFMTRLKAMDSGLPRNVLNDLTNALCGKDKTISFARLIDFLGLKQVTDARDFEDDQENMTLLSREDMGFREEDEEEEEDDDDGRQGENVAHREEMDDSKCTDEEIVRDVLEKIISVIDGSNSGSSPRFNRQELLMQMHSPAKESPTRSIQMPSLDLYQQAPTQHHHHQQQQVNNIKISPRSLHSTSGSSHSPRSGYNHNHTNSHGGATVISGMSSQAQQYYMPSSSSQQQPMFFSAENISPESLHHDTMPQMSTSHSMRASSASGQNGGSMFQSLMDSVQHLPSKHGGLMTHGHTSTLDSYPSPDGKDRAGTFDVTGGSSLSDALKSPVTSHDMEEARRLLQESRRHRGKDVSPLSKMRQQNQLHHQHEVDYKLHDVQEEGDNSREQEDESVAPSPPRSPEDRRQTGLSDTQRSAATASSTLSPHKDVNLSHGAVGYSAQQLVEFGYLKHTGRWRGFPYDSWSCCGSSDVVCPLAPKVRQMSPKKTKDILFIHTEKITPTKRDMQHGIRGNGGLVESDDIHDEENEEPIQRRMKVRYQPHPLPSQSVALSSSSGGGGGSSSIKSTHRHEQQKRTGGLRNSESSPQPRKQAPQLSKFTLDASSLDSRFQANKRSTSSATKALPPPPTLDSSTLRSTLPPPPPPPIHEEGLESGKSDRLRQRDTVVQHKSHRSSTHVQHQPQLPHQQPTKVIERIIIQPPARDSISHQVEATVKQSTSRVLSSYDRALKELRKELEVTRHQSDNRDQKVYRSVERQQQAVVDLKKYVETSLVTFQRSLLQKMQEQQQKQRRTQSQPPSSVQRTSVSHSDHVGESVSKQRSPSLHRTPPHSAEKVPAAIHSRHTPPEDRVHKESRADVEHLHSDENHHRITEEEHAHALKEFQALKDRVKELQGADHFPVDEETLRAPTQARSQSPVTGHERYVQYQQEQQYKQRRQQTLMQEQREALKRKKVAPWIPAARHGNSIFNRLAVVNYSKGHTASSPAKQRPQHRNEPSFPEQERHRMSAVSSSRSPHRGRAEMSISFERPNSSSRSPSALRAQERYYTDVKVVRGGIDSTVSLPSPTWDAYKARQSSPPSTAKKSPYNGNNRYDIGNLQPYDLRASDNGSYFGESSSNAVWAYPPPPHNPERDDALLVDYRQWEEAEDARLRAELGGKSHHSHHHKKRDKESRKKKSATSIQSQSQDEWWKQIMEEKARVEQAAFQRSLT